MRRPALRRGPAAVAAGLAAAVLCASAAQAGVVNRIVAVVDNEIITEQDLRAYVAALQAGQAEAGASGDEGGALEQQSLERLIEHRLMLQEAIRKEVEVDPLEVLKRYTSFRDRFPSDGQFRAELAQAGLSEEQLKRKIREQLLVQQLIDSEVRSRIVVSPQDVAKELRANPQLAKPGTRVRLSHLLVRVGERRSEAQARALIDRLHGQLAEGADFAKLAKQHSEEAHGRDGGDMGWVSPDDLMPALGEAVAGLRPGETSAPVQSPLGFHLIRVEERKDAASLSLTDAHQAVSRQLYQARFRQAMERWLGGLKQKAYIEILPSS
jgi:peptidyl-prolyl cis-trans isomerase SurA